MQHAQAINAPEKVDYITQKLAETFMSRPRSTATRGGRKPADLYGVAGSGNLSRSMNQSMHARLGSAHLTSINPKKATSLLNEANKEYNGVGHSLFLAVHRSSALNDTKKLESVIASRIKDSQRPISTTRPMGSAASTIGLTSVYEQKAPDSARLFDGAANSSMRSSMTQSQPHQTPSAKEGSTSSRPGSAFTRSGYTQGTVITVSTEAAGEAYHLQNHGLDGSAGPGDRTHLHAKKIIGSRQSSRSSSRRESRAGSRVPSAMRKSAALDIAALATDDIQIQGGGRAENNLGDSTEGVAASPPDVSLTTLPYAPHVRPIQKYVTINRLNDGLRILRETNMRYGLGNMEPNTRPIIANSALTVTGIVQPIQSILTEQMMIASSDLSLRMKELSISASGIDFSKLSEREREMLDTQYVAFGQIARSTDSTRQRSARTEKHRQRVVEQDEDAKAGGNGGNEATRMTQSKSGQMKIKTRVDAKIRVPSARQRLSESSYARISDRIKLEKARDLKMRFPDVCNTSEAKMGVKNTVNYSTATPLGGNQHLKGYSVVAASQMLTNTTLTAPDLNNNTLQENVAALNAEPEEYQPVVSACTRRDSGYSPIYGFRPPNILSESSSKARVDLGGRLGT